MITTRKYNVFTALLLLVPGALFAQETVINPAPVWNGAPEVAPGFVPAQPAPGVMPPSGVPPVGGDPYTDSSYFVPVQPSPTFDYFEDEEDPGMAPGGTGGKPEGKESFKMVHPSARTTCHKWTNSILGPTTFSDSGRCEMELGRKVDQGYASIEDLNDRFELFKMKKVIKGDIKNRNEAKQYSMNFDSLRKSLSEANKEGCSCLD